MPTNPWFKFSYGLFVLTSKSGEKESGCIINTAIQSSNTPNTISISVDKSGYTASLVKESGLFNISILDVTAPFSLFKHFGFQSGRDVDKFADFEGKARSENGLYYITESTNAFFSCKVIDCVDLGSYWLFIADVTEEKLLNDEMSVTYTYYQDNIKPKPENVKTEGRVAWRCKICGWIYDNPDLPDDFICPICKHPASDFEKIYL